MNETTKSGLDRIKAAAQTLTELRHTGRFIARLPEATRPQTVDDALRIQERTIKILGEVGGYKCSVPNAERTAPVAPIFASTIHSDVPYKVRQASPGSAGTARIEPEIAFMIGRDLPPRDTPYTENEVRDAMHRQCGDGDFSPKIAPDMVGRDVEVAGYVVVGDVVLLLLVSNL